MFRLVQDCSLWGSDGPNEVIANSMFMPELLQRATSYDWKTLLKLVCQQLDLKATVFVLDESGIIAGCESVNQRSDMETTFYLLKLGDFVFPLMPSADFFNASLPHIVVENKGTLIVSMSARWGGSMTSESGLANHVNLFSFFSALRFLDSYHAKSSKLYGQRRTPQKGIDAFSASSTKFAYVLSRRTMKHLVHDPMRLAGVETESSKLQRISQGSTVIESNASMILRISLYINCFLASKPWGPESTHFILGGGRRAAFLLHLLTRNKMTIVSFEKSVEPHNEAIRITDEYRRATQMNPVIENVLRDTDTITAADILGGTSASRFVGSTRAFQLGNVDKLIFESKYMQVYWNCHISAVEFAKLLQQHGMNIVLSKGWNVITIHNLRQEKTAMTVYLWVRHLDGSILERSPEVISLRNAAAREGPRNAQCGDLRPDDDGFVDSIRRSSRKSVPTLSPSTQAQTSSGTARGKVQRETPESGETREQLRKKQDAAKNGVKNAKTPKVGKVRKQKRTPKQAPQAALKEERTKTKLPKSAAKLEERGRSGLTREEERRQKRIHKAVELLEQVRGTKPDRGERGQATPSAPIAGQEIAGKEIAGRRLGTLASQKIPLKTTEGKERSLKKLKRDPSQANTLVPPERFHRDERQEQEHHRSSREPSPEIQHQPSPEMRSQSPHRPEFKRKANTNTLVPLVSVQENHREPSHQPSPKIRSQSPRRPSMYPREPSHQPSPEIRPQSPRRPSGYPREPSHQPSPKIRSQSPRSPIKYPRELSHQPSPEIHSHSPRRPDTLVLPSWQLQQKANLVEAMRVQVSQRDDLIAALQGEKAAKEAKLKPREPREPGKHEAITDTHFAMKQLELIALMQRENHDAALAKRIKKSVKEKTAKKYSLQKDIEARYALQAKQQAAQDLRLILAATSVSQHSGKANPPSKRSRSRSMRSRSPPKHVGSKSSSSSSLSSSSK